MPLTAADADALDALLREAEQALGDDALARCRECLAEAAAIDPDAAGVAWLTGELAWRDEDLPGARGALQRATTADPEHAEAHWALARVLEALGERAGMIAHDLRVRRLDAKADRLAGVGGRADLDHVEAVAEAVLAELPPEIAARLDNVPVVLEARPSEAVVAEGFDPRALGMFEGPDDHGQRSDAIAVQPTRIVLYYANLLAMCPDDASLAEQIEVTVLHEVGHFFGLDEDEVDALGLG